MYTQQAHLVFVTGIAVAGFVLAVFVCLHFHARLVRMATEEQDRWRRHLELCHGVPLRPASAPRATVLPPTPRGAVLDPMGKTEANSEEVLYQGDDGGGPAVMVLRPSTAVWVAGSGRGER